MESLARLQNNDALPVMKQTRNNAHEACFSSVCWLTKSCIPPHPSQTSSTITVPKSGSATDTRFPFSPLFYSFFKKYTEATVWPRQQRTTEGEEVDVVDDYRRAEKDWQLVTSSTRLRFGWIWHWLTGQGYVVLRVQKSVTLSTNVSVCEKRYKHKRTKFYASLFC